MGPEQARLSPEGSGTAQAAGGGEGRWRRESIACTELVTVGDQTPEPGGLWSQEAGAPLSLSSQTDPGLEMSKKQSSR